MQWNKKCGTNVSNYGGHKKKDLVKCLIFSNLQSLFRASGGATKYLAIIIDNQPGI